MRCIVHVAHGAVIPCCDARARVEHGRVGTRCPSEPRRHTTCVARRRNDMRHATCRARRAECNGCTAEWGTVVRSAAAGGAEALHRPAAHALRRLHRNRQRLGTPTSTVPTRHGVARRTVSHSAWYLSNRTHGRTGRRGAGGSDGSALTALRCALCGRLRGFRSSRLSGKRYSHRRAKRPAIWHRTAPHRTAPHRTARVHAHDRDRCARAVPPPITGRCAHGVVR